MRWAFTSLRVEWDFDRANLHDGLICRHNLGMMMFAELADHFAGALAAFAAAVQLIRGFSPRLSSCALAGIAVRRRDVVR
jgi:hypothetical protein